MPKHASCIMSYCEISTKDSCYGSGIRHIFIYHMNKVKR